jgi:predicted 3-demethylubiquinone-9 3-methyltransferase (glyoxalase superfamily)
MQTITPFLWFDNNLQEAMDFYVSIFKEASITSCSDLGNGIKTSTFELQGQKFMGLQAGPMFKFTEAISFFVSCESQEEVDEYWIKLGEGGEYQMCGWLKDKFGLSWQIIPTALGKLMGDENPAKSGAVVQAMMQMRKIDISGLQAAYDQA